MRPDYNVAIIGAGFAGIGMTLRLKRDREDSFIVLQKASRVGGTWRDNVYPGAARNVQSHLYWFSENRAYGRGLCVTREALSTSCWPPGPEPP